MITIEFFLGSENVPAHVSLRQSHVPRAGDTVFLPSRNQPTPKGRRVEAVRW